MNSLNSTPSAPSQFYSMLWKRLKCMIITNEAEISPSPQRVKSDISEQPFV